MGSVCSLDGCVSPVLGRGMCNRHYKRWMRHGDPTKGSTDQGAPLKWFREVALPHVGAECLHWPYAKAVGYGSVRVNGKTELVHRMVCEATHGPSPSSEHEAAHSCGNAICCNPSHLRWATSKENSADKKIHGTQPIGERVGGSKFREADVLEMRRLRKVGLTFQEIADQFDHDIGATRRIIIGETWAHLPL